MAAAAAPALAFGPPGWAVFAVAVLGTAAIGILAYERSPAHSRARADTKADAVPVEECPNKRPWSVRVQAQGIDIGGTSGSTIGAPPIVQQSPIAAAQGVALASATYALLTSRQQKVRMVAYPKCVAFITSCGGFLGKRTFQDRVGESVRFDVDSFGPSPNFIS